MTARRPSVLFYAALSQPFVPPDLDSHALGGSETALARVAAGLAALGHTVTVAAHPGSRQGVYDGVRYLDVRSAAWRSVDAEVTVVFRQLPHVLRRLPGGVRLFWAHDHLGIFPELPAGMRRAVLERAWRMGGRLFGRYASGIVAVSRWLADCFVRFAGWPAGSVWAIPNAVDHPTYAALQRPGPERPAAETGGVPWRVAYTSAPERGLASLITRIMPAIWRTLPEVELEVFSYRPLGRYQAVPGAADRRIRFRGDVRQAELAGELSRCDLWVYPTDFPETSCIAAMEAQAAGVPVVSSRRYALRETVLDGETGMLIDGAVGSPAYVDRFATAVTDLLRDPARREQMGIRARAHILSRLVWDQIAMQWSDLLNRL